MTRCQKYSSPPFHPQPVTIPGLTQTPPFLRSFQAQAPAGGEMGEDQGEGAAGDWGKGEGEGEGAMREGDGVVKDL